MLARATFLDPRFKKSGFATESGYNTVKESMVAEVSRQVSASSQTSSQSAPEQRRSEAAAWSFSDIDDLIWGDFDGTAAVEVRNPQASAITLIRQFVEEPNIGWQDAPLAWWRARVQVYRELAPLARKHFCIVATSVPSERVFSKTGQLISAKRNLIAAKTVKMVMFLNANYKLSYGQVVSNFLYLHCGMNS